MRDIRVERIRGNRRNKRWGISRWGISEMGYMVKEFLMYKVFAPDKSAGGSCRMNVEEIIKGVSR